MRLCLSVPKPSGCQKGFDRTTRTQPSFYLSISQPKRSHFFVFYFLCICWHQAFRLPRLLCLQFVVDVGWVSWWVRPAQQLRLDDVFVCSAKIQKNQPWSENEWLTFSQHDICILCENMPSQQFKKYFHIISRIHCLSGSINFKWGPAILAVAVCAVGLMPKVGN